MKLKVRVKLGNKLFFKKKKIGILGGTFDPPHKGHLEISKQAKKKFKLTYIIWAITKKNPFKKKCSLSLKERIKFSKKIIKSSKFIKIKFYESKIKSNRTIDLINHIKKNNMLDVYFIMGADNLINFHKWHKWKSISQKCNILVFDRQDYKAKSLKSITFKRLNQRSLDFIKFKKVNISSSQLRKI
jgi:nicotinate-nucleotide adenylyltransferase